MKQLRDKYQRIYDHHYNLVVEGVELLALSLGEMVQLLVLVGETDWVAKSLPC